MRNKIEKHIGETYNYLTIVEILEIQGRNRYVLCKCKCGNFKKVRLSHLTSNNVKSCGCMYGEKDRYGTHHICSKDMKLYGVWHRMVDRCYYTKGDNYKYYGGRGIRVCDEWLPKNNGVVNFYNWAINNGYKKGLTIERIDVNGNYCPENCKWITQAEQMLNTRNSHKITIDGKTKSLKEWCEIYDIFPATYYQRKKKGLTDEEAFTKKKRTRYK